MNDDFSRIRYDIMLELSKGGKSYLNVGDINDSYLTRGLKKLGRTKTVDIRKGADYRANLEKGLKIRDKFDRVVAGEVFEHVYRLRYLLNDINKILLKNGKLIISIPNVCNLKSRIKVLFGKLPTYCADADEFDREVGGHVRDLNVSNIIRILTESGFKVDKVKSSGLWYKNKLIIPPSICRPEWGDNIIISVLK